MRNPHRVSLLALTLLLAGCGVSTPPQAAAPTQAPAAVITVPSPGALTDAELETRYGAALLLRTPTFALLGTDQAAGGLQAQARGGRAQPNRKVYRVEQRPAHATKPGVEMVASGTVGLWGSGTVGLWGSGTVGLWGSGTVGLWGLGEFGPLPANTGLWQSIGLDSAQAKATNLGQGVTVAVLDTGVDLNHPAFVNALTPADTWRDFVDGDALPHDEGTLGQGEAGHGSEVAGITLQIAPGARIMPLRVLDPSGSGDVLNVASAIVWAADHGADVINLSLGASGQVEAVTQAIAYANSRGVLVAAAAGNSGNEGLDYPAAEFSDAALNVSVGSSGAGDLKSGFSRYGAGLSLLAPGENVYGPAPEGRLGAWSGTSMSTPVVAGALALGLGQGSPGEEALGHLRLSAQPVDHLAGNVLFQGKLGQGRVNLAAFSQRLP